MSFWKSPQIKKTWVLIACGVKDAEVGERVEIPQDLCENRTVDIEVRDGQEVRG